MQSILVVRNLFLSALLVSMGNIYSNNETSLRLRKPLLGISFGGYWLGWGTVLQQSDQQQEKKVDVLQIQELPIVTPKVEYKRNQPYSWFIGLFNPIGMPKKTFQNQRQGFVDIRPINGWFKSWKKLITNESKLSLDKVATTIDTSKFVQVTTQFREDVSGLQKQVNELKSKKEESERVVQLYKEKTENDKNELQEQSIELSKINFENKHLQSKNLIFQENVDGLQKQIDSLMQEKRTEFVKGRWRGAFGAVKSGIKNEKLRQAYVQVYQMQKQQDDLIETNRNQFVQGVIKQGIAGAILISENASNHKIVTSLQSTNTKLQEDVSGLQKQMSLLQERRTEFVKGRWKQAFRAVKLKIKNEKLRQAYIQVYRMQKQQDELSVFIDAQVVVADKARAILTKNNSSRVSTTSSSVPPLAMSTPYPNGRQNFNPSSLETSPIENPQTPKDKKPTTGRSTPPQTPGFKMDVSDLDNQRDKSLSFDGSSFDLRYGVGLDPSTRQYPVSNDQSSFEPLNNLNSSSFDVSGISTNSTFNITDDLGGCGLEK